MLTSGNAQSLIRPYYTWYDTHWFSITMKLWEPAASHRKRCSFSNLQAACPLYHDHAESLHISSYPVHVAHAALNLPLALRNASNARSRSSAERSSQAECWTWIGLQLCVTKMCQLRRQTGKAWFQALTTFRALECSRVAVVCFRQTNPLSIHATQHAEPPGTSFIECCD